MTVKDLKKELERFENGAEINLWEDSETQGIAIYPHGEPLPEHVIEIP